MPVVCPSLCATQCGDNVRAGAEECDDGNTLNGDGCSALCQIERQDCGNGRKDQNEECDDGNMIGGDGCSALCGIEQGWYCQEPVSCGSSSSQGPVSALPM